jgi:hypothetical protein
MNKDQEQMLIETHAFSKMNHKALYGDDGLVKRVTAMETTFRTSKAIGVGIIAVAGIFIALIGLAVS